MKGKGMKNRAGAIFSALSMIFCAFLFINPVFCADDVKTAGNIDTNRNPDADKTIDIPAKGLAVTRGGEITQVTPEVVPVLKRIDINRISAAPAYETFEGLRLAKYFTIAQRVEIYQEARPIDAYIMDAKKIRWLHWNQPWNNPADFRSQIKPIFTRAYGTEVTMSDPRHPEGQWRYTLDYREIYQNQFPIYRMNPTAARIDIPYLVNTNYTHE